MTRIVKAEDLTGPPEGTDPDAFLGSLVFDDDLVLDPALEAELRHPMDPLEKVAAPSEVTISWDYRTRLRIEQIAQARGISVGDVLDEIAELEVARLDALEARARRNHDAA